MTKHTYILNLDPKFDPMPLMGSNLEAKQLDFKGGEPHIQIIGQYDGNDELIITQRYTNIKDLVMVILANDAARRMGFKNIELVMPYFPAARQDRVCNAGEPLTIKVFADMINGCNFDKVSIFTPHSDVTPALLDNCHVLDLDIDFISEIIVDDEENQTYNIVCPDAGAGKRVGDIVKKLANTLPHRSFNLIRCEKVRDVKDGSLKEFHVQSENLGGYPTIIIDDLVCYGGTFKGLGEVLRSKNCGELSLYVSHADCMEGLQSMCEYFDKVYTTNSRFDWDTCIFPDIYKLKCFKITL